MYIVFDLETNTKIAFKRKANFMFNKIVAVGLKMENLELPLYAYGDSEVSIWLHKLIEYDLIIGHNIKFDLLYIWDQPWFQSWLANGGKIYDTSLAHYFLSGQQDKFPALRDVAVKHYGCKEREKKMEAYWDQGIDTDQIPMELVTEDVTNDVMDTESIYLQQLVKAEEMGLTKLLELHMDAILATTEMEFNGLMVSKDMLMQNREELLKETTKVESTLKELLLKYD